MNFCRNLRGIYHGALVRLFNSNGKCVGQQVPLQQFSCMTSSKWSPEGESGNKSDMSLREQWQWVQPQGHDTGIQVKNSYYCIRKEGLDVTVPFIVSNPDYVTWYACGPTVYDSSHLGHASTFLQFDLIRRILTKYFGLNICMVMGITNMDTKIVNRALLHERDVTEIADFYEAEFRNNLISFNILPPTTYIRVTDVIPDIICFINKLVNDDKAYVTEKGDVYFSYNSAHQSIAKLYKEFYEPDEGVAEKKFAKDFLLWKTPKPGEPYWDAPWGKGRPGWHIECSVMATMCFGGKVDIHTGANDLRFPHHEFEIAQCDAYHGCHQWVNYFLHTGHLHVKKGEKMSKSLGNFIAIQDFLEKYNDPDIFRFLCAQTNWHKNFVFSTKSIKQSMKEMRELSAFLKFCRKIISGKVHVAMENAIVLEALAKCKVQILDDFKNNFDTTSAMRRVKTLTKTVSNAVVESETTAIDNSGIIAVTNFLESFLDNLGFSFHRK